MPTTPANPVRTTKAVTTALVIPALLLALLLQTSAQSIPSNINVYLPPIHRQESNQNAQVSLNLPQAGTLEIEKTCAATPKPRTSIVDGTHPTAIHFALDLTKIANSTPVEAKFTPTQGQPQNLILTLYPNRVSSLVIMTRKDGKVTLKSTTSRTIKISSSQGVSWDTDTGMQIHGKLQGSGYVHIEGVGRLELP